MFYRLVRFNLDSGKLDSAKAIFADLLPQIKSQPGCKDAISFGDDASGNYGFAVVWESAEASQAARSIMGPQLSKHLADNDASENPFSTELFEIF
jgi:quinol monooxygenase YgiN